MHEEMQPSISQQRRFASKGIFKYTHIILSVLCILLLGLWVFYLAPELFKLPHDYVQSRQYNIRSTGSEFIFDESEISVRIAGSALNRGILEGEQTSELKDIAVHIAAQEYQSISIDRYSQTYITGTANSNAEPYVSGPKLQGVLTNQRDRDTFLIHDILFGNTVAMSFIQISDIEGRRTYKYEGNAYQESCYHAGHSDLDAYQPCQIAYTLWLDPYTGVILNEYMTLRGENGIDEFVLEYNAFTQREQLLTNAVSRAEYIFAEYVISIIILLLGLLSILYPRLSYVYWRFSQRTQRSFVHAAFVPGIAALWLLISTGIFAYLGTRFFNVIRENDFASEILVLHDQIESSLEIQVNTLLAARGLFDASDEVTRDEWKKYVDSLNVIKNYPGTQGFGFAVWLDPEEVEAHEASVREEGFPNYAIYPVGERDQYTAIVFLEPFDERNQQAFGFDMYQESVRREAMDRAREMMEPALSGKVTLVQEIDEFIQPGFLIYVPLYEPDLPLETPEQRESALRGFIYSPFRAQNFIKNSLPYISESIHVEIFDGEGEDLLTESRRLYGRILGEDTFKTSIVPLEFAGHTWTVRYSAALPYGVTVIGVIAPYIIVVIGIIISILVFSLLYITGKRKDTAVTMAMRMTQDLQRQTTENTQIKEDLKKSNEALEEKAARLEDTLRDVEAVNKHMIKRELRMKELKQEIRDASKQKYGE